jgi:hypothetical protein
MGHLRFSDTEQLSAPSLRLPLISVALGYAETHNIRKTQLFGVPTSPLRFLGT